MMTFCSLKHSRQTGKMCIKQKLFFVIWRYLML